MKITRKKIAPWAVAALCLSLASGSALADDTTATGQSPQNSQNTPSGQTTGQPNQNNQSQYNENQANQSGASNETSEEGKPVRFDRASGIVGMNVRNQNDEHLGKIKDVVFDMKSERIAYVVLAASGTGVMGFNDKLHAVPINAFTPSADGRYLILRADKSKLEAAAGFDRKNWPSATNPSWGAQPFWENSGSDKSDYNRNGTGTQNDQPVKPESPSENK